jgi:hypothetical protein
MARGRGGIGGSGIFGGVGIGTGIVCDSKDNSAYCSFTKIVSVIINLFIVCLILYFVFNWLKTYIGSGSGKSIFSGGRRG